MKKNAYLGWTNFIFKGDGFFSMKPLLHMMEEQIPVDSFGSLAIKLFVTATDFTNNKSITFSKGPLFQAVIASASVPVIFEPVLIDNRLLVDGGILNNFPIEPIEKMADLVIGCYVNNVGPIKANTGNIGKTRLLERSLSMATSLSVYSKKDRCALF